MIRRSCQIVLLLMVVLALLSPVIQRNSPDNFPVAGDDIELQALCILSGVGIFLLLARWLRVLPLLISCLIRQPVSSRVSASINPQIKDSSLQRFLPLRI
jgi:hypothetical protein